MDPLPRPEVILTHESDLDGLLAAMLCRRLAKALFGTEPPVQAFHNDKWRQFTVSAPSAWVCDLAFEPRLDRPNWVIFDHHPFDPQPKSARLIHAPDKSAALLACEICREHGLTNDKLERLVQLSNTADLFLANNPEFDEAGDYASLVKHYGFWTVWRLVGGEPEGLVDHPLLQVVRMKRAIEDPIGLAWARDHLTRLSDEVGLVETLLGNSNLILHQLLDEPGQPFRVLLTLYRRGNGAYLVSLRSRDGTAGRIAERLQGGGHPNASGAVLPRSIRSFQDAVLYLQQTIAPSRPGAGGLASLEQAFEAPSAVI
jgi:hypothetical protein